MEDCTYEVWRDGGSRACAYRCTKDEATQIANGLVKRGYAPAYTVNADGITTHYGKDESVSSAWTDFQNAH